MSREFKVGDVVHIKSEGHMELQYGMYEHSERECVLEPSRGTDETFCKWCRAMFAFCGCKATVHRKTEYKNNYIYEVKIDGDNTGWSWSPQCFEEYDMED